MNPPRLTSRTPTALLACGVVTVAVALLWLQPWRDGSAPAVEVGANHVEREVVQAAPAAQGEAADAASGGAREPERIAVPRVTVRGHLRALVAVTWGANGAEPNTPLAVGEDASITFETEPMSRLELVGYAEGGQRASRTFERDAGLAASDWELGLVEFWPFEVTVACEVRGAANVLAALIGSGQHQLTVEVREPGAGGQPLARHAFDLRHAGADQVLTASCEVHLAAADAPLLAEWFFEAPALRPRLPLPAAEVVSLGPLRRSARLDLLPENVVSGRLAWPDGEGAGGQTLVFWVTGAGETGRRVATGLDGGFCFVVGDDGLGTVEGDGVEGAFGVAPPSRPVAAGETVTLHLPARLRFRVVDAVGQPLRGYTLETALPRARVASADDQGVAFEFATVLEEHPWIRVHRGGAECSTFLVPPAWFAATDRVHDLVLTDAQPTGSVEVEVAGSRAERDPWTRILLRGEGPLHGLELVRNLTGAAPWRLEGIPAGRYRALFDRLGRQTEVGEAVIVAPARVTKLILPRT